MEARMTAHARPPEDDLGGKNELQREVDALLCLRQMDTEASAAYEVAAASMLDEGIAQIMRDFAVNHRQHASAIDRLVSELGGEDVLLASDPEIATFAMMAEALSELGTWAGIRAMIASESFTNAAYDAALESISNPRALALLQHNFDDERRQLQTLTHLLARRELGFSRGEAE